MDLWARSVLNPRQLLRVHSVGPACNFVSPQDGKDSNTLVSGVIPDTLMVSIGD